MTTETESAPRGCNSEGRGKADRQSALREEVYTAAPVDANATVTPRPCPPATVTQHPVGLSARPQWVCWRYAKRNGKATKEPVDPKTGRKASATDPTTWGTLEDALARLVRDSSLAGVGYVFAEDDPYCGVDIDDVVDPATGEIAGWAANAIAHLDSYTEITPSGRGFHIIAKAKLPGPGRNDHKHGREMYDRERYFTVTGNHLPGTPSTVEDRQQQVETLYRNWWPPEPEQGPPPRSEARGDLPLSDQELIEKAHRAANGQKFGTLWRGDWQAAGYGSQSEGDLALCSALAFWCDRDAARMDRLFRGSGLSRPKWNQSAGGGQTYGQRTIEKAISSTREGYRPGASERAPRQGEAGATGGAANEDTKPETRTWPVVVDIADFLAREFPPRDNVLAPWLPVQGLAMVYGWRGVGKTWVGLNVAYAVASGGEFLGWRASEPRGVLYLDGEMPAAVLQERLARIVASVDQEALAPLRIITPDLQPNGMPDLAGEAGQIAVNACIDSDIGLIVVDNLSTLARGVRENEADDWVTLQSWALYQRALGRSVLFLHHSGKGGQQRGTSRREDVLDTVIALRRPGDYNPHDGAKFEVHFEKARGIFGEDVAAFESHLTQGQDGRAVWTRRTLEESTYDKVLPLLREGLAQRDIAEELGIHKSQVSRHAKKAGELGDWTPPKKSNKRATEGATGADKRAGNDD